MGNANDYEVVRMKFYTNKTKPKCGKWIRILDNTYCVEDVIIVPENKKELSFREFFWSEWKDETIYWQYEENFDKIFKNKLGIKEEQ